MIEYRKYNDGSFVIKRVSYYFYNETIQLGNAPHLNNSQVEDIRNIVGSIITQEDITLLNFKQYGAIGCLITWPGHQDYWMMGGLSCHFDCLMEDDMIIVLYYDKGFAYFHDNVPTTYLKIQNYQKTFVSCLCGEPIFSQFNVDGFSMWYNTDAIQIGSFLYSYVQYTPSGGFIFKFLHENTSLLPAVDPRYISNVHYCVRWYTCFRVLYSIFSNVELEGLSYFRSISDGAIDLQNSIVGLDTSAAAEGLTNTGIVSNYPDYEVAGVCSNDVESQQFIKCLNLGDSSNNIYKLYYSSSLSAIFQERINKFFASVTGIYNVMRAFLLSHSQGATLETSDGFILTCTVSDLIGSKVFEILHSINPDTATLSTYTTVRSEIGGSIKDLAFRFLRYDSSSKEVSWQTIQVTSYVPIFDKKMSGFGWTGDGDYKWTGGETKLFGPTSYNGHEHHVRYAIRNGQIIRVIDAAFGVLRCTFTSSSKFVRFWYGYPKYVSMNDAERFINIWFEKIVTDHSASISRITNETRYYNLRKKMDENDIDENWKSKTDPLHDLYWGSGEKAGYWVRTPRILFTYEQVVSTENVTPDVEVDPLEDWEIVEMYIKEFGDIRMVYVDGAGQPILASMVGPNDYNKVLVSEAVHDLNDLDERYGHNVKQLIVAKVAREIDRVWDKASVSTFTSNGSQSYEPYVSDI